ncbi:MAG: BTAD domain-containing putative transcriptional regulator, partial [Chloroflexota bacterium]
MSKPLLKLELLGGLALEQVGSPMPEVKSQKGLALLCYLAVSQKQQTRSFLAGLFWPDMPESQARMNLRQVLQRLKALKPYLLITRKSVAFDQEANYWLDVAAFAEGTAISQDIPSLQEAISLYQGDFLDGFMLADAPLFEEWVLAQRAQLRETALIALQRLVAHFQEEKAYEPAISYARQLLAIEPWHEETHRDLMRLLAYSGQRSAALAQFDICRQLLVDELGVEPAAATVRLAVQIKAGEVSAEAGDSLPPHNLPPQMTPFVGRKAELAQLQQLLAEPDVHLITILGSGGMGKTRLALALAERQLSSLGVGSDTHPYQHGVYFVSLARLETADLLLPAIAEAINLRFAAEDNQQKQLLRYLAGKAMLLLLDNFEHLLAGTGLIEEILRAAPQVKIIITSRVKVNRQIEQLFPIEGMAYPPEKGATSEAGTLNLSHYSAVQLFVQCARRLRPGFELTADNQGHVLEICRLLQGMPLGIVLATSWLASLSLETISHEIHQDIDFLATDMGDVPLRQRSLRAAFNHSWRLLSEREQEIFCQLSIFSGGFTRVAAQAVTGATLRDLQALVNKSLLMLSPERRYDVHELLRQFAAEKLIQTPTSYDAAHDAHCDYYCTFLHKRESDLKTSRKATT